MKEKWYRLQCRVWEWFFTRYFKEAIETELKRKEVEMRNYLADQHAQAVRKEREQLARLIRPLIRVRANYHLQEFNLSYTVTISDNLLFNSRNDRKALVDHLALQIAHELMVVQPIQAECDVPRSYPVH